MEIYRIMRNFNSVLSVILRHCRRISQLVCEARIHERSFTYVQDDKCGRKALALILISFFVFLPFITTPVRADAAIDKGINFLKEKQDSSGKITSGYGSVSDWSSIAFAANSVDITTVKKTISLKDFLLSDSSKTSATDVEARILAIVATGYDPTNFGGINYVDKLKTFYNSSQIGDSSGLNDDFFGILALVASNVGSSDIVINNSLTFMLSHQNSDGGWGYATGADSDSNDTAAAIQAMIAIKNYGVSNPNLETAINTGEAYLLNTQDSVSGGFFYDKMPWTSTPDSDSTGLALMTLNALGMKDSAQATNAKNYLFSQQSSTDGGFLSYSGSDSTTTAQALTALAGKSWILKIFNPSDASQTSPVTPIASGSPSSTPTPTSTPGTTNSCQDIVPNPPVISQAVFNDNNSVKVTWDKLSDQISHYVVNVSNSEDTTDKGNSLINDKNATSYTTNSLPKDVTYYIKVKAGNGCSTGDFSNTAIVAISKKSVPKKLENTPTPTPEVLGVASHREQSKNKQETKLQPPENNLPMNKGFMGFSILSFSGAILYWYLKLKIS